MPLHDVEVPKRPATAFRPFPNLWVQAIVRYQVDRKEAGWVKIYLSRRLLAELNLTPEKLLFPKNKFR